MYLSGLAALQNQRHAGTLLGGNQMLVQSGYRKQGRNRHMVLIHAPVGDNQDIRAVPISTVRLHIQTIHGLLQAGIFIIGNRNHFYLETGNLHALNLQDIRVRQNRMVDAKQSAVFRGLLQHISFLAHIHGGRGDDFLTDGVDGRIGNLGEPLLEIVKKRRMLLGQCRQRGVDTHGSDALGSVLGHLQDGGTVFLVVVSKGLLQFSALICGKLRYSFIGDLQIL